MYQQTDIELEINCLSNLTNIKLDLFELTDNVYLLYNFVVMPFYLPDLYLLLLIFDMSNNQCVVRDDNDE